MSDEEEAEEQLHLPRVFEPEVESAPLSEVQKWYDPTRLEKVRRGKARSTNAIHDTFDLIGGVPRLAEWANDNPGHFFTRLFAKTVERAGSIEHSGEIKVVSAVPRTVLDGISEAEDAEFTEVPDA